MTNPISKFCHPLVVAFLLLTWIPLCAQDLRFYRKAAPFTVRDSSGAPYQFPFSGGLNRPIMQFVDIDGDQDADLFMVDQFSLLVFFRNSGSPRQPRFDWVTEQFGDIELGDWFRFSDSDGDGDADLYVENPFNLIRLYRNDSDSLAVHFTLASDILLDESNEQIVTDGFAVPAWMDVDCDGDEDLFLGRQSGQISLYENRGADAEGVPSYRLVTDSFQDIRIVTNGAAGALPRGGAGATAIDGLLRHGANYLTFTDIDGDTDNDLFWGDFFSSSIVRGENSGSCSTPMFLEENISESFPPPAPLSTGGFNTATFVDLDDDGDPDMFAGVLGGSRSTLSSIINNMYYYENTGGAGPAEFALRSERFFYTLDVGRLSKVALVDIDSDSDLDMFITNQEDLESSSGENSRMYFYENIGAAQQPSFQLTDSHYLNLDRQYDYNYAPAFIDIDDNGTMDLFLGTADGRLVFYRNDGTPTQPRLVRAEEGYAGIDVGNNSTPAFVDIDDDGDADLFIGNFNGNLHFYENNGSPRAAAFTKITENYCGISVKNLSHPAFADINGDGDYDLLLGSFSGGMRLYRNIGTPRAAKLVRDERFRSADYTFATPHIADMDHDGDADIIAGVAGGGLLYLENGFDAAAAGLQVEPTTLDFGKVIVGRMDTLTISLFNSGDRLIRIESAAISGGGDGRFQLLTGTPIDVAAGEQLFLGIRFQGAAERRSEAQLTLSTDRQDLQVRLIASGVAVTHDLFLYPNYPNPFNGQTVLSYEMHLPAEDVGKWHTLTVYNTLGQRLRQWRRRNQSVNLRQEIVWDGRNDHGDLLPSGLYLAVLRNTSGDTKVDKLLLIR